MAGYLKRIFPGTILVFLLTACSGQVTGHLQKSAIPSPHQWVENSAPGPVEDAWLHSLQIPALPGLATTGLNGNHRLRQLWIDWKIAEQQVKGAAAGLLPQLDVTIEQSRSGNFEQDGAVNSASVDVSLKHDLDIWGKLSDAERQAVHNAGAAQARFKQARQTLVADIATAWIDNVEAGNLVALARLREQNLRQNLNIIETGYERGLYAALDIYLARNALDAETAAISVEHSVEMEARRDLERLLGHYPAGKLTSGLALPSLAAPVQTGIPTDILFRKAALNAAWQNLRARHAGLAFAHKERLPGLSLKLSVTDVANLATNFASGAPVAWSILGSITAPLFDGGRLKSAEDVARLEMQKAEQQYLDEVYAAFLAVETATEREASLLRQYTATQKARESADAAAGLSFEQYQKGLVDYLTVLDSQSRSYDAAISLVRIKSRLLRNRIALHLSLGGDFDHQSVKGQKP